jgi:hypothetical protein
MKSIESIANLFGKLNIEDNELDDELTKKMRIMNIIVILISPLTLLAIIFLYFYLNNYIRTILISIYLLSMLTFLFSKGRNKRIIFYINKGFLLSTLILLSNITSDYQINQPSIEEFLIPKFALIIPCIAVILLVPRSKKFFFYFSLIYNFSVFLLFENILQIFNLDFYNNVIFSEVYANSYSNIVLMTNLLFVIIMLLLFIYEYTLNFENKNLNNELTQTKSILEKYKEENSLLNDKIIEIKQYLDQ